MGSEVLRGVGRVLLSGVRALWWVFTALLSVVLGNTGCAGASDDPSMEASPAPSEAAFASPSIDAPCRVAAAATLASAFLEGGASGCALSTEPGSYAFVAPREGYVQVRVESQGVPVLRVRALDGETMGLAVSATRTPGEAQMLTFAVRSGARYDVEVSATTALRYRVRASFVAVPDAYEPNDTPASAPVVPVQAPVFGYFFAAALAPSAPAAAFDDYYAVDLAAGEVRVTLDEVPHVALAVALFDPSGNLVAEEHAGDPTSAVVLGAAAPTAGRYLVRVFQPGGALPMALRDDLPPPSFSKPYRLRFAQ